MKSIKGFLKECSSDSDLKYILSIIEAAHREVSAGGDPDQAFSVLEMKIEQMVHQHSGPELSGDELERERATDIAIDDAREGGYSPSVAKGKKFR